MGINRKTFFLFPVLFFSLALKAQLGIWAGATKTSVKYPSFDRFRSSYNQTNSASLKKEMPGFGLSNGFSFAVQLRANWFMGEVGADFLRGNTSAEFLNGERRDFNLKKGVATGGFGLGYGWQKFYIFAIGGLASGDIVINSSFVYTDGTRSFGMEKSLNGHYHGIFLGGYYGLTSCIPIGKHIKIMLRGTHEGVSRSDSKRSASQLLEQHQARGLAGFNPQSGGLESTNIDLTGWRFFLCLHLELERDND